MTPTAVLPQEESIILNGIPAPEIRSQLDLVLRSRVFFQSHRIRRFLRFVVEESLLGQPHRLKEYLIGLEVFDRREAFDPRVDSIVRVEARRLRYKLEEYYNSEGREDSVRIVLRKGSYVPIFEHRASGSYAANLAQRRVIEIAPFASFNVTLQTKPVAQEIQRRVSHFFIKDGCFQVLAKSGAPAASVSEDSSAAGASLKMGSPENGNGTHAGRPDYVVEGSIEFSDSTFHLLLQLHQGTGAGSYISSEAADCPVEDLASVDRLAQALVRDLLTPPPDSVVLRRSHGARESGDAYLEGRYFWKLATPDSIHDSAACFARAVESDAGYGAAWAAFSQALLVSSMFGFEGAGANAGKIMETARKAAALSGALPECHLALGSALSLVDRDWAAGEKELEKSIQLDRHDPVAHVTYGIHLACRGLFNAALGEVESALDLDPASLFPNFVLGWMYGVARRYDDAVTQHRLVARLAPDYGLAHLGLGLAFVGKAMFTDAIAHFTNASQMKCRSLLRGEIGYCYARSGREDEARREIAALAAQADGRPVWPVSLAMIHAGMGEQENALGLLESAVEMRDASLPLLLLGTEFDSLRTEPRFLALRQKIGLAEPGGSF